MSKQNGRIKKLLVFQNGNIAVFRENGDQVPELQRHTLLEWFAKSAESLGYDTDGCRFETPLGSGSFFGSKPIEEETE